MTDDELRAHQDQSERWRWRINDEVRGGPISDADRALIHLVESYAEAADALYYVRTCFPGRATAACNAVCSLHAAISALWFEREGDAFSKPVPR